MDLKRKLFWALLVLVIVVVCGTAGYRFLTHGPWLDCLYMTTITLSSVGYGEVLSGMDKNPSARVFTIVLILIGIGILMYVISITTAFIVEGELTVILRRRKMERKIASLKGHYIVCGAGTTGKHIARELQLTGRNFVIIEKDESVLGPLDKDKNLLYIIGDATEDDTLKKAGILEAHGLMAVLSDDKDNLFITLTARQMNPSLRIVAKAVLEGSESKLISAGANTVVAPNRIGALRIVSEMVRPAVVTFLDQMLRESEQAIRFEEVRIPPGSKWIGKRIEALTLHKKSGISIIGLRSEGEKKFIFNPRPDAVLQPGMTLVVLGNVSEAHALQNLLN